MAMTTTNNNFYNKSIEKLNRYQVDPLDMYRCEKNLHMPMKYKRYLPAPNELCDHYPPKRSPLKLNPKITDNAK
jgi:hypothetical protein